MLEKRNKFYFPVDDVHFNGEEYQRPHRFNSLRYVPKFGTAIDVGAHVGTWAVDFVNMFDKTICFEPIAEHRECLKKNLYNSKASLVGLIATMCLFIISFTYY